MKDDGDIFRAYGFLAIRWGNLEDELEETYSLAERQWARLKEYSHLRFADKAKHLSRELSRQFKAAPEYPLKPSDEPRARSVLNACQTLAKERNEYLHGSVIAPKKMVVIKNKTGIRPITSLEIYELVEDIHQISGAVYGLQFVIRRLAVALKK